MCKSETFSFPVSYGLISGYMMVCADELLYLLGGGAVWESLSLPIHVVPILIVVVDEL